MINAATKAPRELRPTRSGCSDAGSGRRSGHPGDRHVELLPDAVLSLLQSESMRTAVETPFNTVIIVNSYDAFSDRPAQSQSGGGAQRAGRPGRRRHGQTAFVDLQSVPAENISVASIPTAPPQRPTACPHRTALTRPLRDAGLPGPLADALDDLLQPMVDAGYAAAPAPATAAPSVMIAAARPIDGPVR